MILICLGNDEGKMASSGQALFDQHAPSKQDEFNAEIISGTADNAESAFQICQNVAAGLQTLGLFGGEKIIWLKNANFLGDDRTGRSARAKEGVETILAAALREGLPEGTTFLLTTTTIDKRRTFWKWLQKNAQVETHDRIDTSKDGWEQKVQRLVLLEAKEKKIAFKPDALEAFIMRVGEQARQISSELEKLSLCLGENATITLETIQLLVPQSHKSIIWEIGRAIEKKRGSEAIRLINQQLDQGESAIAILRASIIPTIRTLLYTRLILDEAPQARDFKSALLDAPRPLREALPKKKDGSVNSWGLTLAAPHARAFQAATLQQAMEECLQADHALVTTQLDPRLVIHKLIASFLTSKKNRPSKRISHSSLVKTSITH